MKKSLKKFAGLVVTAALTASCAAFATGCSSEGIIQSLQSSLSFSQVYDYSALGGINLLNSSVGAVAEATPMNAVQAVSQVENEEAERVDENAVTLGEEEKNEILLNLEIARNIINGGVVKSEVTSSDREGYDFMYTLTAKDVDGTDATYFFYYNSTERLNDEEDDPDENDKENDDEKEILMEGIVVVGENEYVMRGEQSVEEGETEVEFKVMIDENNYVIIEQETSDDEQEYEYTMYKNREKVFSTSVEYETEEDGETELKFKTRTSDGKDVVYKYEFFTDEKGSFVEIKTENQSSETKVLIAITTGAEGETVYEFVYAKSETQEEKSSEEDEKNDEDDKKEEDEADEDNNEQDEE